jgi:hypothetical protein
MLKKQLQLPDTLQTHVRKKECSYSISFSSDDLPTWTLRKDSNQTKLWWWTIDKNTKSHFYQD